jgi:hypothetical protein
MNLCNGGSPTTTCYSYGKAVDEAVLKIYQYHPEAVTLQEVCHDDVFAPNNLPGYGKLGQAMVDVYGSNARLAFSPAWNNDTNDWFRCANGETFGVAVMHHYNGTDTTCGAGFTMMGGSCAGWYGNQDSSNETRTLLCTTVINGQLTVCTTHLSTDRNMAMAQCQELMGFWISQLSTPQIIVAGDFNLRYEPGNPNNVQNCVPSNFDRKSDSDVQQAFFTRTISWVWGKYEGMMWTDHPLLYEQLRI